MSAIITLTPSYAVIMQNLYATTAFATEDGNNNGNVYSFSYATGNNSTYSFGLYQYDVGNNAAAASFLSSIGFSRQDISALSQKGDPLSSAQINSYSNELVSALSNPTNAAALVQLNNNWFQNNILPATTYLLTSAVEDNPTIAGEILSSPAAIQNILDFTNQFGAYSIPSGALGTQANFEAYLSGQTVQINSNTPAVNWNINNPSAIANIQAFIMATPYGAGKTSAGPITNQAEANREQSFDNAIGQETSSPTQITISPAAGAGGEYRNNK